MSSADIMYLKFKVYYNYCFVEHSVKIKDCLIQTNAQYLKNNKHLEKVP